MIETQGREWIESIKDYIESPVPIQQAPVCAPRYLGAEPEVLEFFLRGQSSLCRLSGERRSSHLERIGSGEWTVEKWPGISGKATFVR